MDKTTATTATGYDGRWNWRVFLLALSHARTSYHAVVAVFIRQLAADPKHVARNHPGNDRICMVVLSVLREALHEKARNKVFRTACGRTNAGLQFNCFNSY